MILNPDSFVDMIGLVPGKVNWVLGMVDISSCTQCIGLSENERQIDLVVRDQDSQPIVVVLKDSKLQVLDGNHRVGIALRRGMKYLYGYYGEVE